MRRLKLLPLGLFCALATSEGTSLAGSPLDTVKINPLREAYYGDLHLHTSYSLDAYLQGNVSVDPDEAYRFAKGEVLRYLGQSVQRREPLDFLAVTDHAENLGVFNALDDPNSALSRSEVGKRSRMIRESLMSPEAQSPSNQVESFFREFLLGDKNKLPEALKAESAAGWAREIDFANRNYVPGKFTTFIAYEWTAVSLPSWANLHRNVIFRGNSAPRPFTAFDSKRPEDLWAWLEAIRKQGFEALAIPHNANASNGLMYDWVDSYSHQIGQAYAEHRQANEPLSEISQIKGASETHPLLAQNDEFADYEIFDYLAGARHQVGRVEGSYLRDALSRGLVLQRQLGINPYKYGFVGGSDLHGGLSVSAQADFAGAVHGNEVALSSSALSQAQAAHALGGGESETRRLTSGNLTGVWAESNTRESIYDALRRKETFATTGTKLKIRFFGGWNFDKTLLQEVDWVAAAYARGVPMGGDLPARTDIVAVPTFVVYAVKDPNAGSLDRVQLVKVWEEGGKQMQKVFDVVWSGRRQQRTATDNLPAVGSTVDLKTGHFTNDIGATQLQAVWSDPAFDPRNFAAYYMRVLEIPTPRWSTLVAIEAGLPLPSDVPAEVQQRGWSSPIWYTPTQVGSERR
ncbi:MAG TPA: DUF3604 domain-containing protein [Steroidobacteraceae bacterium]|jgi:hypothetical protein